jgi:hypothetical protein
MKLIRRAFIRGGTALAAAGALPGSARAKTASTRASHPGNGRAPAQGGLDATTW